MVKITVNLHSVCKQLGPPMNKAMNLQRACILYCTVCVSLMFKQEPGLEGDSHAHVSPSVSVSHTWPLFNRCA